MQMCESKKVVLKKTWRMWREPASLLILATQRELDRAGKESSIFDSPCKEVAGSIADVGTAWSFYRHIDAPGGAVAIGVT